ncbi:BYS1 domain protein [Penicillium macrosclerotiorum]|uniref:BYS1 domain protein n=1 Tax=Penicillium macrosclerotiorum TaxID=303699 RepID=UPI0025480912|nr:BYS1 domain protein [Penicillium macrosclerotiorum]KAJ5688809.1 BYS1 domain protein [Penicillium macrosclerotiorum]
MRVAVSEPLSLPPLPFWPPLASAVGNAVVENHCDSPVYLWSVGSSVGERQTIDPGANYSEELRHDDVSGGIALKITTTENGLYDGSPQTDFAYALSGTEVFYDLSDVFGDPFSGKTLVVNPSVDTCNNICWSGGIAATAASQTESCTSDSDVTLTLCADSC